MMSNRPPALDPLTLGPSDLSLATDLYQLTMAAVYHRYAPERRASFELFVRRLPDHRNFLIFAGLEQALAALQAVRFDTEQIAYLRSLPPFQQVHDGFFQHLAEFRFRGSVVAMPEGTAFFPYEPVLRVTGSLLECQLVETLLLSTINFQTTIASKAARIRTAAGEQLGLAEFGGRRAHGPQAATWVARAAILGGFDSTSNVLAGHRLGVPVVGTMAHSYILAFEDEETAFRHYREVFPEHAIFLVDTYDSVEGIRRAARLGVDFDGVRLDSGEIPALAVTARELLDAAGHREAKIFVSGDMDEWSIARLRESAAPVDAAGVGTLLATSADAPYLPGVYKLVEVELGGTMVPRWKRSTGKQSHGGRKQVMRLVRDGRLVKDRLVPAGHDPAESEVALLRAWMRNGELIQALPSLEESRRHRAAELARLPKRLRSLEPATEGLEVEVAAELAGG